MVQRPFIHGPAPVGTIIHLAALAPHRLVCNCVGTIARSPHVPCVSVRSLDCCWWIWNCWAAAAATLYWGEAEAVRHRRRRRQLCELHHHHRGRRTFFCKVWPSCGQIFFSVRSCGKARYRTPQPRGSAERVTVRLDFGGLLEKEFESVYG